MNNFECENTITNDNFIAVNSLIKNEDAVQTKHVQTNDVQEAQVLPQKDRPFPGEDNVYLDELLNQFDGEKRKEIIENLIRDRESLKIKKLTEIENIKDHLRTMKHSGAYNINQAMPLNDLAKLYSNFNHLAVEEEIKAWKDISILCLKLFDEGLTGSGNHENKAI